MNLKLIYPRQWMATFSKSELWPWTTTDIMDQHHRQGESSSTGAQVREKPETLRSWGALAPKHLHCTAQENQMAKLPSAPHTLTHTPEPGAAPGKPPCAGIPESQNLFPGVSCDIQHSTELLKERGKEQEKQQQHKEGCEQMCVGCSTVTAPPKQPQSRDSRGAGA